MNKGLKGGFSKSFGDKVRGIGEAGVLCVGTEHGHEHEIDFAALSKKGVRHACFEFPKEYEKDLRNIGSIGDYNKRIKATEQMLDRLSSKDSAPFKERSPETYRKQTEAFSEMLHSAHKNGMEIHAVDAKHDISREAIGKLERGEVSIKRDFVERGLQTIANHSNFNNAAVLEHAINKRNENRTFNSQIMSTVGDRNSAIASEVAGIVKKENEPAVVVLGSLHTGKYPHRDLDGERKRTNGVEDFLREDHGIRAASVDLRGKNADADRKTTSGKFSEFLDKNFPKGMNSPMREGKSSNVSIQQINHQQMDR